MKSLYLELLCIFVHGSMMRVCEILRIKFGGDQAPEFRKVLLLALVAYRHTRLRRATAARTLRLKQTAASRGLPDLY